MSASESRSVRPPEAERDQAESAFTPILRGVWRSVPNVLAAVFVDVEGECIDYVSSLDPFEAKVTAAHMRILFDAAADGGRVSPCGSPIALEISGAERELWGQRVSEEYVLVALALPGFERAHLRDALQRAVREFREEVGLGVPPWEGRRKRPEVIVRVAVGWPYAPVSLREGGTTISITDVLGRWIEAREGGDQDVVCFRVRTEDGNEFTLAHDPGREGWEVRT